MLMVEEGGHFSETRPKPFTLRQASASFSCEASSTVFRTSLASRREGNIFPSANHTRVIIQVGAGSPMVSSSRGGSYEFVFEFFFLVS